MKGRKDGNGEIKEDRRGIKIQYLEFTFNRIGNYKDHIKDLVKKGKFAAKKIWDLGEKLCRNDFISRWDLFKYLIQSVLR